ncbi:ubiquitin carboxyl-terminal hydrolase MINDY-1 isoform X2 [Erinaceus europaeus]|uniref:Ubiquitin carboxyl-terminal hydrolase n=1 Tax=Erinaceus europaeus TaxID=9365 RepID=A0ABM3Y9F3_ERIEU|nr:ubiquitin carboxyl-terminal hydrolase MINDY-1 isoform X2 [Erinaceus europaeus]
MDHQEQEPPASAEARTADTASLEDPEVPLEPAELPLSKDTRDADKAAGPQELAGPAQELPAQRQEPADPAQEPPAQSLDGLKDPSPGADSSQLEPAQQAGSEVETVGASPRPQEPLQSPRARQSEVDFYCVKWIPWKGERTPIITQSTNGPCPLLAIMNILFLQWKVKLPPQKEVITSDELMAHLGDCLLSIKPQEKSEGLQLNFQQNVEDAMTVLPKLATGLDVNVRFTGVSDFEYTPECSIFDLLGIPLYHGWLVDPQSLEAVSAVGKLSYNQLVEKIITCKHSQDTNLVTEGLIAEQFLETTAAQLTYHGLCELTATAKEGELCVFFRNNHFSTMTKHKSHLYLLVTDQGFLQEEQVVWESLHNVDGDSCFCDSDFHLSHSLGKDPGAEGGSGSPEKQRQLDQQQQQPQGAVGLSDLELAQQLQQEEYQQQQVGQPAQVRGPLPQVSLSSSSFSGLIPHPWHSHPALVSTRPRLESGPHHPGGSFYTVISFPFSLCFLIFFFFFWRGDEKIEWGRERERPADLHHHL